jgi:hypothetical protein
MLAACNTARPLASLPNLPLLLLKFTFFAFRFFRA